MARFHMRYTAYQLSIDSDLALPELPADASIASMQAAQIQIKLGHVSPAGIPDGQQMGPFLWAKPDMLWLSVPHVARFQIENGHTIWIDPAPGADEDSIRVFLLGSALGALLFQRGHLVLHGNAIRIGDQCMVCVGPSGAGKSTLAAGFLQRGHAVLADDVVPIDAECRAMPGFPRIKLWQDSASNLEIDTTHLRRIRPDMEKFNLPLNAQFSQKALPVRWIYILGSHNSNEFKVEPIRGMQRFAPLRNNTYRLRYMQGMTLSSTHMARCGQLAGRIHLARVTRPKQGFQVEALIDHLLNDMAGHP
jgi:hypothetical protein